jgi:uncharacterized DUF497 family protein
MKLHKQFEWDPKKARINARKHSVTFEDAEDVLGDDQGDAHHWETFDDAHSTDEDRHVTIGSHPDRRRLLLTIVWTERTKGGTRITRIISARLANSQERKRYAQELSRR